jgi:hypothetical protein
MEVFAELTKLQAARNKDPKAEKNIVDTEARKHIEQNLGVTQDNLCRYLKKFKDRHLLIPATADEEWVVNPILIPELIKNTVQITIILHTYDTVSEEKINKVASIKETGGVAD